MFVGAVCLSLYTLTPFHFLPRPTAAPNLMIQGPFVYPYIAVLEL